MSESATLLLNLVVAGLLGGLIGFERSFRAKEAGIRTHFLVALGSALFMLVSQYAFTGSVRFDASRVAAQVVSGIGFLGAGIIIFQKNSIRGLTTAAGLWVVSAIGLACGAGMYLVAAAATLLSLVCLETMHFLQHHFSTKALSVTFLVPDKESLKSVYGELKPYIENYSMEAREDGGYEFSVMLRTNYRTHESLPEKFETRFNGVKVKRIESS